MDNQIKLVFLEMKNQLHTKKISHISTTFNMRSGSARRTSAIINKLVEEGVDVSLIVGRDGDLTISNLPNTKIYKIPDLVKHISVKLDLTALYKIYKTLKKIKPEIVHTHLAKGGILGRLAARLSGIPCIIHTVHGPTFPKGINPLNRTIYLIIEKLCSIFTDHFIFVGEELRQSYINANICSKKNSWVIYTGRQDSDVDRKPLSLKKKYELRKDISGGDKDQFLIVTVGRIVPAKQFHHGVTILKKLRNTKGIDAHLAIVGKALIQEEQKYERELHKIAKNEGVDNNITFTGYRPDVLDIMEASDAVLLTSRYEGLPNVAVESMTVGTPMVAYSVSGAGEVLSQSEIGYIVKQNDTEDAIEALNHIYLNKQLINKNKLKHRDKALYKWKESYMIEQKLLFYSMILK
jgi:glycosyltransferase involved in cell wall biosynthesis